MTATRSRWRRGEGTYRRAQPDDHLAAACWCKTTIVDVPRQEILNGLTRPCPDPHCRHLDIRHRQENQPWAS